MNTFKYFLFSVVLSALYLLPSISHAQYHAEILIDASTGNVIRESNSTHAWYPASLTKVMTLYLTFTALNNGQIHLNDTITTSPHAAKQPNSKLGLRVNELLTVEEAILALITRSANDAAVALAEHIAGSEESFAVKMTTKAHELGMFDSHFMNATGLPHDWQVTTPRDMALLAWKTQRNFPNFYPYFSAHSFYFKGRELPAINKFTAHYPGAEGMKTGFTCGSGYNLISSASHNGRRLIGVVMGGTTSHERYQLMTNLMNAGFDNPISVGRSITGMTNGYAGSPPYLLSCGNRASTVIPVESERVVHHSYRHRAVKAQHHLSHSKNHTPKIQTLAHNKSSKKWIVPSHRQKLPSKATSAHLAHRSAGHKTINTLPNKTKKTRRYHVAKH